MTSGPLTRVDTLVEEIDFDVSRKLKWGKGIVLEFIVPDRSQVDNWRVVGTRTKGFDRVVQEEKTQKDGSDVVLKVADRIGDLGTTLRQTDLHVRVDGNIYRVAHVPQIGANEAQVYTLTCKVRTLRTAFDTTKR